MNMRNITYALVLLILAVAGPWMSLTAQVQTPSIKPVTSTEGYDFYVAFMPNGASKPTDKDLKLQLFVNSREANRVRLEYADGSTKDYNVPAGGTTTIDVDPKKAYWDEEKGEEEMILEKGVRVYSLDKKPMTVYSGNQNGEGGTSSFDGAHVLPKEALGQEYVIQSANDDNIATEFVVMSTRPGTTTVTVELNVKSRKGKKDRLTISFKKAKQIYIIRSKEIDPNQPNDVMDLSGSTICADAPVAVWSGNQSAIIPNQAGMTADHTYDQLLPVNRWGQEFIVPMTGMKMQMNELHIISLKESTNVTVSGVGASGVRTKAMGALEKWKIPVVNYTTDLIDSVFVVKANNPIQVYLYTSSAASNIYMENGLRHFQGDPSMTMISPLEFVTDTTIFSTYEAGNKTSKHQLVLWAKQSVLGSLQMNGAAIGSQLTQAVPGMPDYKFARIDVNPGIYTLTAAERGFGGYVYGLGEGQAYLYPAGYTFKPYQDSLSLNDPNQEYPVFRSEWNENYLNDGGWYLDKEEQKDGTYILDSIRVCDSTELTFPIKMYNEWDHVKWEIIGSIQGSRYFAAEEQYATETSKPELTHQFLLLPKNKNIRPFEDFAVRAVVYHKPIMCDNIKQEKWPKDTLNTTVRVFRAYNDTTWRVICEGAKLTFFKDTTADGKVYQTSFNNDTHDVSNGQYKYELGENIITRHYVSAGGCDSLSTLRLFVCPRYEEDKEMVVCAGDLHRVNAELGDFFKNIDFVDSYSKKSGWKKQTNGSWLYTGKSTLKTKGCMSSITEYLQHGVTNYKGCDSILNLKLYVIPMVEYATKEVVCTKSYDWKDENGNLLKTISSATPGVKRDTIGIPYAYCPDCPQGGCDSIRYTVELTFVSSDGITQEVHICQNEEKVSWTYSDASGTKTWDFETAGKNSGKYPQPAVSFTTKENCAYDYTVVFVIDPIYNLQSDSVLYCYEDGFNVVHKWEGQKGFDVTYPNGNLLQEVDSFVITTPGTYHLEYASKTIRGCDSIWTQVVVVLPSYTMPTVVHNMSSEDYYEWGRLILAGKDAINIPNPDGLEIRQYDLGEYELVDNLGTKPINGQSCDSIISLVLRIGENYRDTIYDAVCSNCGAYDWQVYDETTADSVILTTITDLPLPGKTRIYRDSLKTTFPVPGLDSVHVLYLTGYPYYEIVESTTICQGEEFIWTGHMQGDNGWAHNLYMNGEPITAIPTDSAGVFTLRDEMKTHEMLFTNPKTGEQKKIQCDSVHVLTLTICKTYNYLYNTAEVTDSTSIKSNEMMAYFDDKILFVGCDYDWQSSLNTLDELRAQYDKVVVLNDVENWLDSVQGSSQCGCDSMHYVYIHICKLKTTTLKESIGDNNTTWQFGGDELDENGNRIHTHPLITGEKFHYYDDGTPVDYSANKDKTIREYHFVDTVLTEFGCDSIIYATVKVYPTYRFESDTTVCSNQHLDWRKYKELNHKNSGLWYDSLRTRTPGLAGFDSIYVLDLTLVATYEEHANISLCKNDTVVIQNYKIYYEEDHLKETIILRYEKQTPVAETVGCDSVFTFKMTYNDAYGYVGSKDYEDWVDTAYTCRYEDFKWLDKNGKEHKTNLRDSSGKHYAKVPTDTVGWITIYDSLKTKGCDCDSIYTLQLYVGEAFRRYDTIYACSNDTVLWEMKPDTTYIYNGQSDIDDILPGIGLNGCDSSYYLHIHFDKHYDILKTVHLCTDVKQFTWEDLVFDSLIMASKNWDEPYHETFVREYTTAQSGCDSIMRLDITIAPSHDSLWADTICAGETYMFYGQELTTSGTYTVDQPNEWGCYTHLYLTLEVVEPTQFEVTPEPICVDEDGMANTYVLHYAYNGMFMPISYTISYDSAAQAEGFQNQENIPIPTAPNTMEEGKDYVLQIPVPSYVNRGDYPRPGYYQAQVAFDNGVCQSDSMMTYPFEMVMRYPSWITQQHWNDAILIMDSTQNGGYVFSAYQWYRDGEILYGETRPYLFAPEWLEDGSEYTVALTREDDQVTVLTCPIIPDLSGDYDNSPTQTYISVVPTLVAKENPVVYILSPTNGSYKLYNSQGQLVTQGDYTPNEYNAGQVVLPNISGVYIFHLVENTTMNTGTDLRRTVKVIVQ